MTNGSKCIMVVGAHAADAEIMAGATVLKHVDAGWRAVIVHMTPGEKGHRNLSPEEYARIKVEEANNAAHILGADCVMLPYKDGELPVNLDVQWAIADIIRQFRPTVLLTHWQGSLHRESPQHQSERHGKPVPGAAAGVRAPARGARPVEGTVCRELGGRGRLQARPVPGCSRRLR